MSTAREIKMRNDWQCSNVFNSSEDTQMFARKKRSESRQPTSSLLSMF